jgi:hypothetical protein
MSVTTTSRAGSPRPESQRGANAPEMSHREILEVLIG